GRQPVWAPARPVASEGPFTVRKVTRGLRDKTTITEDFGTRKRILKKGAIDEGSNYRISKSSNPNCSKVLLWDSGSRFNSKIKGEGCHRAARMFDSSFIRGVTKLTWRHACHTGWNSSWMRSSS